MTESKTNRDALKDRQLPEMTFSTGLPSSLTGPPDPVPQDLDADGRALYRFAVEGNAISTLTTFRVLHLETFCFKLST